MARKTQEFSPLTICNSIITVLFHNTVLMQRFKVNTGMNLLISKIINHITTISSRNTSAVILNCFTVSRSTNQSIKTFIVTLLNMASPLKILRQFLHLLQTNSSRKVDHIALVTKNINLIIPRITRFTSQTIILTNTRICASDTQPSHRNQFLIQFLIVGSDHSTITTRHCLHCLERPHSNITFGSSTRSIATVSTIFQNESIIELTDLINRCRSSSMIYCNDCISVWSQMLTHILRIQTQSIIKNINNV